MRNMIQTKAVLHVPVQCFSSSFFSPPVCSLRVLLAVLRTAALVLVATQGKGGLALWLGHLAGQVDERLDERAPVGHRNLPEPDFLLTSPLLRRLTFHSPLLGHVQLIPQNHNRHLQTDETETTGHEDRQEGYRKMCKSPKVD